jgi:hypothetical protein
MMWICRDCAHTHCLYIDDSDTTVNAPDTCPRNQSRGEPESANWRALTNDENDAVEYIEEVLE